MVQRPATRYVCHRLQKKIACGRHTYRVGMGDTRAMKTQGASSYWTSYHTWTSHDPSSPIHPEVT